MHSPHDGKTNPCDRNFFHHDKTERHYQGECNYNRKFCCNSHSAFLNERFKMLFVKFCADKPVVQTLGAVRKANKCQQKKRSCRQNRQCDSHAADA